ncbi:MAG TPA: 3-phosphoserine/phosphohydroxythreonine transaminase [Levilinea sp.]|nr:3-phosphoserine/phosphohydroxythreonine transaminase [Levilinea sp.]
MTKELTHRVHNFNAGPAVLPLPVLEQAQAEMLDYQGIGMSVMEISHRSKPFEGIIQTAEADLRELLQIPENYKVMFVQGGATLQFAMIPMNLRPQGSSADYVVTGSWSKGALEESSKVGLARTAASTADFGFNCLPAPADIDYDPNAAFLHFCMNETIHGVEFKDNIPTPPPGVELVCDISSDFVSRPMDVSKFGVLFAGAQKNAGPAGVTIVIVRQDLLERVPANLPALLDLKVLAESGSLHNTPPAYSIYIVGLVMKWLKSLGGLEVMERMNTEKVGLLYDTIDNSAGYYRGHALPDARSNMNVPFRMQSEELEKMFVKEAEGAGFIGLKGHRSVGGLRASLYNALPKESVLALIDFMNDFKNKHG